MSPRLLIAATAASICCSAARADYTAKVDEFAQPLINANAIVGCVVGIVEEGKTEVHAYGEVRRGGGQRPDGKTIYEIGSITKTFTGTLLADMVARDLVKLDTPLQELVPAGVKVPVVEDKPITVLDLATHTSGLPRMPDNFAPKDPRNPYVDYTPDLMFAFLKNHKLRRPPGEVEYSNFGMGLLGHVLSAKAGQLYEVLVVDRICKPLDMADTRITLSDEQKRRLAPGTNGSLDPEPSWDFDALKPAGGLRSTADDLLKLAVAALSEDDRPVTKAIHAAWQPRTGKPGDIRIGLAWHTARDNTTHWHNGQTGGYHAAVFIHPPKKLGVVVLSNTGNGYGSELAEKILQTILGMQPAPIKVRKSIDLPPEKLERLAGKYVMSVFFAITVTVEDGKLFAQATGQDKIQVFASSETEFFYKVVDAQLSFEKDGDGNFNKLILHQNGQNMPGLRLPTK